MATSTKNNRVQQLAAEQKLIDGTNQFLSQIPSFMVGSQSMTSAQIVQVFEDRIAKGKAAIAAADARTAAVKADRDERQKTAPFVNAFKRIVVGMFQQSPDTLGVFGLKPPKVAKKTAQDKATAAVKTKATRTARGPVGRKQRAKVKGTTATTGSPQATPTTTAPTTTPTATAASPAPMPGPTAAPSTAVGAAPALKAGS